MIELKLDPKWKWAAMDEDEEWRLHEDKPEPGEYCWHNRADETPVFLFCSTPVVAWRDSPHEIVHQDGKVYLKKHVDIPADGEPVIVGKGELRRYSAGKLNEDGDLECYCDGATRWSGNEEDLTAWKYWRRPTEEELND